MASLLKLYFKISFLNCLRRLWVIFHCEDAHYHVIIQLPYSTFQSLSVYRHLKFYKSVKIGFSIHCRPLRNILKQWNSLPIVKGRKRYLSCRKLFLNFHRVFFVLQFPAYWSLFLRVGVEIGHLFHCKDSRELKQHLFTMISSQQAQHLPSTPLLYSHLFGDDMKNRGSVNIHAGIFPRNLVA